ncbi:hypothetical protein [Streptomyces hundungensis]|uniref:hypothetical protein n=1 Tax=Streptomyces hundungensis TaxID=1077946 RepID=UPI0031EF0817
MTEKMRHVIGRTVFTWNGGAQIAIWYPWQPKCGNPIRPLFSATYSAEHGVGDQFDFATTGEFAEFCETHAAKHPYLIDDPENRNEEE